AVAGLVPGGVEDETARRGGVLRTVEELQAHALGVPAEEGEIDAIPPRVCAQGERNARADRLDLTQAQEPLQLGQLRRARTWFRGCWLIVLVPYSPDLVRLHRPSPVP